MTEFFVALFFGDWAHQLIWLCSQTNYLDRISGRLTRSLIQKKTTTCIFPSQLAHMNNMQPVKIVPGQAVFFEKILNPRRIADLDRIAFNSAFNDLFPGRACAFGKGPN
jgi:hypothetical protein